jgi:large conductance mechanosensitive channel
MESLRNMGERGLRSTFSTLGDFRKFILRGNVVDLAVGIVIGAAFTSVVNGFVTDFITPLIGIFGIRNFIALTFTVNGNNFQVGAFINTLISFLITAFVVYFFVVKPVNALTERVFPHKAAPLTTRNCPYCLSAIPLAATRCAYCTSAVQPADTTAAPVK